MPINSSMVSAEVFITNITFIFTFAIWGTAGRFLLCFCNTVLQMKLLGNIKKLFTQLLHYRPQRSCEGYVFTPVCHSVHRGGLPQCMLGYHTPPGKHTHTPREAHTPPGSIHTHSPSWETAAAADGTHPTGMHSCYL